MDGGQRLGDRGRLWKGVLGAGRRSMDEAVVPWAAQRAQEGSWQGFRVWPAHKGLCSHHTRCWHRSKQEGRASPMSTMKTDSHDPSVETQDGEGGRRGCSEARTGTSWEEEGKYPGVTCRPETDADHEDIEGQVRDKMRNSGQVCGGEGQPGTTWLSHYKAAF